MINLLESHASYVLNEQQRSVSTAESLYSAVNKDLRVETSCITFLIIAMCVALEQFCCHMIVT